MFKASEKGPQNLVYVGPNRYPPADIMCGFVKTISFPMSRIAKCLAIVFLFVGPTFHSFVAANPKVRAVPIEIPYKILGDKLKTLGHALEIDWPFFPTEEDDKYYKKSVKPEFYVSSTSKWIIIKLGFESGDTITWIYNKLSGEKPYPVDAQIYSHSELFWYGEEVLEFRWVTTRLEEITHSILVNLSQNPRSARLEGLIFYDTEKDIYLALRNDQERLITDGLLEVGKVFTEMIGPEQKLGTIRINYEIARQMPPNLISEVIFDEETMIVKVDWVDKTRYVKFHPKFLKGKK